MNLYFLLLTWNFWGSFDHTAGIRGFHPIQESSSVSSHGGVVWIGEVVPLVGGGYDWGLAWDFFKPLEFMLFDGFFPENILCHGIHHHFAVTSLGEYI